MPEPIATGLTVADFERLGEDDGMLKRELIDGELFVAPRPTWRHQCVVLRIGRRLLEYTEIRGGAASTEPGMRSSDRDEVSPDVVLVSYERDQIPEFWFVDLEADIVQVYRLGSSGKYEPPLVFTKDDEIRPPHLPGLVVEVADLLGLTR